MKDLVADLIDRVSLQPQLSNNLFVDQILANDVITQYQLETLLSPEGETQNSATGYCTSCPAWNFHVYSWRRLARRICFQEHSDPCLPRRFALPRENTRNSWRNAGTVHFSNGRDRTVVTFT